MTTVRRIATCRSALPGLLLLFLTGLCTNNAWAQGTLTNGWTHTGTISPVGDSDSWTFSANIGDSIVIRVGEITQTNSFTPRIRLQNPSAVQIASASSAVAAEIAVTATNSGTFTVIVDDAVGTTATGTYRLTLAQSPGAIFVAPGDEGGALVNGVTYETNNLPPGDLDVWTFSANSGDSFLVKIGQITETSNFEPWIRLYGPTGTLLFSQFDTASVEVALRATNSGGFTVVVANNPYYTDAASGTYRITLAKTGSPNTVAAGDEGGPLTNGVVHQGSLPTGDLDLWTFSATAGDSIVLKMGQITETGPFDPWIRLYGPNGALLDSQTDVSSTEITLRATNSGTFLVVVGNNPYYSDAASGTYFLNLAKTGDAIVVSPGDEGGPLTNGAIHQGSISVGDLDLWNFSATAGDSIVLKIGQATESGPFDPWIRLYGPDGALLSSQAGVNSTEITLRATNSGTFLVVVANNPYYSDAATGTYLLNLAKTGDPFVVSPGDEGGPLTNGVIHQGSISVGDLDLWNFTANAGDSIVLKIGQITETGPFDPWIRLYGPNGVLLDSQADVAAAEITLRATNSGTFLVVVANNPYYSDAAVGTYLLNLAKTGSPITVSPGDEGGPLTNGLPQQANLPVGDLDLWSFTAVPGQNIIVRAGQLTETNNFDPWIRIYGPDGALLGSVADVVAAELNFRTTNGGTFLVVIANNPYYNDAGSGNYVVTLAKTGDPFFVAPGDQGGSLTGAGSYTGNMPVGDIDLWSFTACLGDFVDVRADETTQTNSFAPWIRIFGPSGVLLGSSFGATTAEVSLRTTNRGTFLIVLANNGYYNDAGSGTYQLTVSGLSDGLKLCIPAILGTNATLSGIGGTPNATYILFTQTNVASPLATWTPIRTNQFDSFGVFNYTNLFNRAEPQRFFLLEQP